MKKPIVNEIERRTAGATSLRAAAGKEMVIEGTAASYNVLSNDLGGFREQIAPGAFDLSLSDTSQDVKCLINHSPDQILGRKQNGTLKVWSDARGLQFRCVLDPNNTSHRDAYASIKRGDFSECSFAFIVPQDGDSWDFASTPPVRTLRNVTCIDVSSCVYPAYGAAGATTVSARALAAATTRKSGTPASHAVADQIRRHKVEVLGDVVAADRRALAQGDLSATAKQLEETEAERELRSRMQSAAGICFGRT